MFQSDMNFEEIFSKEQKLLIRNEFERLKDLCYLDQTGCAPYTKSQLSAVLNDLQENVYSNPHSGSITGKHCSDSVDQIRYKILQHFNTNVDEYSIIFTSGATAALKLVAESFCWSSINKDSQTEEWYPKEQSLSKNKDGNFVYMEDNHTSVLGMREVVIERGANVKCLKHNETLDIFLRSDEYKRSSDNYDTNSLFVYSAQCNFSGLKYPLSWIEKVKNGILDSTCGQSNWCTLLDAATYVSTNNLDLNKFKPDFVCLSFYKIFGYPTGLGALLVRNSSAHLLQKAYYGGGTVLISLSSERPYVPRPVLHERFEDGTINFLSILALEHGFEVFKNLVGNIENVSKHCFNLSRYAFYSLLKLHHSNGSPAIYLYADTPYDDRITQGNIVTFNILRANGDFVGFAEVMHIANLHGIQLRTGCFCNPGACRRHLGLTNDDLRRHYQSGHVCGDDKDLVNGNPTGAVRISFGYYNTKEDIDKLLNMIEKCFIKQPTIRKVPFLWDFTAKCLKKKFYPIDDNQLFEIKPLKLFNIQYSWFEFTESIIPSCNDYNEGIISEMDIKEEVTLRRNTQPYLSHIFVYPLKSCARFAVNEWQLNSKGLLYDRNWMIVNASGVALTQKKEPKMCKIRPVIDLKAKKLTLSFEGYPSMCIDLENDFKKTDSLIKGDLSLCQSKVCGDRIQGIDYGDEIAGWLSTVLGRPGLRLIRQLAEDNRKNKKTSGLLTLTNQAQYLLINVQSVKWLCDKLESTDCTGESMLDRFRCNFAISEIGPPFVEQEWKKVKIGNVNFTVDGPCSRCQMICIDQESGEYSKEPLTILTANTNGKLKFGIYLSSTAGSEHSDDTIISVGDHLVVEQ